jgi:hypothetical protein
LHGINDIYISEAIDLNGAVLLRKYNANRLVGGLKCKRTTNDKNKYDD